MEFQRFKELQQRHFLEVSEGQNVLFVTDVDKDELWNLYLDSFPPGTNEIFRERREFDCSCCRQFIRSFGNVVFIDKEYGLSSIWDFVGDEKFNPVVNTLSEFVKSAAVKDVFVSKQGGFGTDKNHEQLGDRIHTWHHFRIDLPKRFVYNSNKSESAITASYRDSKNVFKRSLEEISRYAIETVLDLIAEKSLYRGEEWQFVLTQFLELHDEYHSLSDDKKDNYCWRKSFELGGSVSKIRNHSIGVLLQDITSGMDILDTVKRYEKIVAPTNYKRPKAIFTKKMVEDAEKTIVELGLLDSLGRRHAVLSDITVNNVLWANRDATKHMAGASSIFETLKQEVTVKPEKFKNVPVVDIEHFTTEILPDTTNLEVLLENRHESNLMSLIAPKVADSPTLFKWHNPFCHVYNGNISDSMKQRVKAAGGNVEGVLRFSLQWNDNYDNRNDYDAHCVEPDGNHIWYSNKGIRHPSTGMLDVDIIHPGHREVAVENITWTNESRMQKGIYKFYVHNYSHRGGVSGFDAEIEYGGQIYEFVYHKELYQGEEVIVAIIHFDNGIKFLESLPSTTSNKTIWNLQTNQFHPVSVYMFSPNYWDNQHGIGNKHYFFMLADCQNDTQPNGFFNEYLKEEFMEHKRVFAALGNKMKVENSDYQLSGLGFSSTKQNSLVCKTNDKVVKIVF